MPLGHLLLGAEGVVLPRDEQAHPEAAELEVDGGVAKDGAGSQGRLTVEIVEIGAQGADGPWAENVYGKVEVEPRTAGVGHAVGHCSGVEGLRAAALRRADGRAAAAYDVGRADDGAAVEIDLIAWVPGEVGGMGGTGKTATQCQQAEYVVALRHAAQHSSK